MDKLDTISQLLADVTWVLGSMLEEERGDEDYKNLDEVISYLETVKCVLPERILT
jgi:hypothetical protein